MEVLCSIVVPVYNEENNIEKCLDVIKRQTYSNIETIFVNDGSTDSSQLILDQLVEKYSNHKIKVIHQSNKGAASARENGVLNATGDFIATLDCDDELSENAILEAMKNFEEDVDIVLFDLKFKKIVDDQVVLKDFPYLTKEKFVSGREALRSSLDSWGVHGLGVFRKNVFLDAINIYIKYNNDNFVNNDEVITRVNFLLSRRIKFSEGVYYYNFNANSTTRSFNINLYKTIFNAIILYKILKDDVVFEIDPDFLVACFWGNMVYFYKKRSLIPNKNDWIASFKLMSDFMNENMIFTKLSLKRKIQFILIFMLRKLF